MPSDEAYLLEIGRRIAHIRKARGLSQKALAKKAKLSESHVFRVERGTNTSVQTLLALVRALSVPIEVLFASELDETALSESNEPMSLPQHRLRDSAVEKISDFVETLAGEERRRAIRVLQAAFPRR